MRVGPASVMCVVGRLERGAARAGSPVASIHALLESAQRLELRIHVHEHPDQPLRLLERPLDLLAADGVERALELLVEAQQVGDVANARLREPAAELGVVAPELLGLALDLA